MPEPSIRIVVIEDRRDIREGLKALIAFTTGYECVATYRSMEEALAEIERAHADVALVDIGLPRMSGIEGIRLSRFSLARRCKSSCVRPTAKQGIRRCPSFSTVSITTLRKASSRASSGIARLIRKIAARKRPTSTTSPYLYYDGDTAGARMDNVSRSTWTVAAKPARSLKLPHKPWGFWVASKSRATTSPKTERLR